ncbi:MAG: LegC family aminotransferase [Actinobacteria bacterium]|nr:LegC family aminotransferase [Actinomycetota bacterium]
MSSHEGERHLPLSVPVVSGNERAYVADCLDSGWLSGAGAYVGRFEAAVCEVTGAAHAVATASGTAALHVGLILAGVGAGDAVIVPTVTFIASANAVRYVGADPVLIGCDDRLGLDPVLLGEYLAASADSSSGLVVDRASGRIVKAIMPVHVFGDPCDMEPILALADRYGLPIIEDATESLGSTFSSGRFAGRSTGTLGRLGAFSFNGNKIISTGSGGMLVTDDEGLAARARYLCAQAKDDPLRYVHGAVGFNYSLSNVSAAVGLGQIETLAARIDTKRANRARYAEGFDGVPGLHFMKAPDGTDPNCWFYSLLIEPAEFGSDREQVMAHLADAGIQTRPLWLPVHMQRPYAGCTVVGPERAVWYWERILNLPCTSDLSEADVDRVVRAVRSLAGS